MAVTIESLGLTWLNLHEKLELVGQPWDEIVAEVPPGGLLSDAQREELHHRVAEAEAHPEDFATWDEVFSATLRRFSP